MTDTKNKHQLLSPARTFCLEQVAKGPRCTWPVCSAAAAVNLMKTWRKSYEWADKHFAYLRKAGLIERTGEKSEYGRSVHQITDAGKAKLAEVSQ